MDPFTQRMLEKAEQRSRALGISNASKFQMSDCASGQSTGSGGDDAVSNPALTTQWQKPQQKQPSAHRSPMKTSTHVSTNTASSNKQLQVVEKKVAKEVVVAGNSSSSGLSPSKILRQFSAVNKENMDLGIEINIMMDKNVEVEVHVEEQSTTTDDDDDSNRPRQQQQERITESINQPTAKIRDTSRNHLQRLGALYSKPDDLSSPIHRTEGKFCAEDTSELSPKKPKQRYGKLAALANSINQWEDDITPHHASVTTTTTKTSSVPPPKPDLPSRRLAQQQQKQRAPEPPTQTSTDSTASTATMQHSNTATGTKPKQAEKKAVETSTSSSSSSVQSKTKQLKWDPHVINSLEAQGFQRRESNTAKLAYEYETQPDEAETHMQGLQTQLASNDNNSAQSKSTAVGKVTTAEVFKGPQTEKKQIVEKNVAAPPVKTGLVSGRAAVFEHKAAINQQQQQQQQQQQRSQKDPTELSLKERMQLFERNKGNALMPKAAFGMAPSISKIRQENANIRKEPMKVSAPSGSSAPTVNVHKPSGDSGVRNKVAALVANATTISENKIKADIQKQRQEDMQILANRFNKQKEIFAKEQEEQQQKELELKAQTSQQSTVQTKQTVDATKNSSSLRQPAPPPPPPPPMPTHSATNSPMNTLTAKRRSPGDSIDDESKRARKSNNAIITERTWLYPALSDLESNESFNCGTTATPPHSDGARADDHDEDDVASQDDDNCNDSYMDSEEDSSACLGNNSLGREVLQVVKQNEQQQNPTQNKVINKQFKEVHYADKDLYYGGDSSMNSSEASMGVDDYLNEALDENIEDGDDDFTQESDDGDENNSRASRGSKGTTASNSFSFRKTPKRFSNCHPISEENDNYQTPTTATTTSFSTQQPVKSELCVNREDDNMVTLVHTVSFYRKQKNANSNNSTPVRRICREEQVFRSTPMSGSPASAQMEFEAQQQRDDYSNDEDSQSDGDLVDKSHLVQEKIKKLLDEVCKQQQVIAQTSQALNLCAATIEFSGSTESVEGERHLLVATHRRQACLDEVQRLRVEKSLRPIGAPKEKGRLTVKEIILPLRQEYIRKLAADTISGHHLVCLLKYNEHVLATKTVPTLPGLLAVKFPDVLQLNNVYADFRITLEIYGMTAQREVLPHEVKYHINLNKKTGIKTPKKKGADNRLVMPPVQSPAGPNVVRTPALVQHGFAIFSLREIQRTTWTLTQVLGFSPLDGAVHMKVNCELSVSVEYKGFLTMFEDVSGFGAWHRRWCYLSGTMLNFWKYPDDETKKTPIGSIDLYTCSSQKVTLAPRDICARLNTMLLECQRPALDTDKESLIIVPNGRTTTVRYLLSADTKEEREEWCAYFNKALTLLRAWGPPQ